MKKTLNLIYILFALSGFVGLIYESLWARYLKLFLGHSSYGQVLTLFIYMGGLGVGSFIAGKIISKIKRPFYCYALIELSIGIIGIFYHNIYNAITQIFFSYFSNQKTSFVLLNMIKILISFFITFPSAILLGMTFPIIIAGVIRITGDKGQTSISRLYFFNSFGAAVGVLICSFILIPWLGSQEALIISGMINITLALFFFLFSKQYDQKLLVNNVQPEPINNETFIFKKNLLPSIKLNIFFWLLVSCVTGFSSFLYEIGWIRFFSLLLGSSTHSFDIMLSAFIFGLSIGGLCSKYFLKKDINLPFSLGCIQLLMGCFALLSIYFYKPFFLIINYSHLVLKNSETAYPVYCLVKYAICLLVIFPTCFMAGMTLPIITYFLINYVRNEKYTGFVYGWNTIGSILGAVLGGLYLLPVLQLKNIIVFGALIDIILGLLLFFFYGISFQRIKYILIITIIFILPSCFLKLNSEILTAGFFRAYQSNSSFKKVIIRDGKTATVSFHENAYKKILRINGKTDASFSYEQGNKSDELTQAAVAFYPMQLMNKPYTAAIIGIGSGLSAHYILSDSLLKKLDVIEIEKEVYNLAEKFLPYNERLFADRRVKASFEDARTFFFNGDNKYNLIISEPSNPWVSGIANLFTVEFYQQIKQVLTSDGVLVQWIHLYEFNNDLLLSIMKALDEVFRFVKIYNIPGSNSIVLISSQNVFKINSKRIQSNPSVKNDLFSLGVDLDFFGEQNYIISANFFKPILRFVNPNSDFFPLIDNGAEKAFFLKQKADLFLPFISSDNFCLYKNVLEAELTDNYINNKAMYYDKSLSNYLIYLLQNISPNSDWNSINNMFYNSFSGVINEELWNNREEVKLLRQLTDKGIPPEKIKLQFKFIDHVMQKKFEMVHQDINDIVSMFNANELTEPYIRALVIYSLKLKDKKLYKSVLNKFVSSNSQMNDYEIWLLEESYNSIA